MTTELPNQDPMVAGEGLHCARYEIRNDQDSTSSLSEFVACEPPKFEAVTASLDLNSAQDSDTERDSEIIRQLKTIDVLEPLEHPCLCHGASVSGLDSYGFIDLKGTGQLVSSVDPPLSPTAADYRLTETDDELCLAESELLSSSPRSDLPRSSPGVLTEHDVGTSPPSSSPPMLSSPFSSSQTPCTLDKIVPQARYCEDLDNNTTKSSQQSPQVVADELSSVVETAHSGSAISLEVLVCDEDVSRLLTGVELLTPGTTILSSESLPDSCKIAGSHYTHMLLSAQSNDSLYNDPLQSGNPVILNTAAGCLIEPGETATRSLSPRRPEKRKSNHESSGEASRSCRLPAPKRMTLASQKRQYKKLSTPFRSPVIKNATVEGPAVVPEHREAPALLPPAPKYTLIPNVLSKKYRTAKAGSQFKSPLGCGVNVNAAPLARLTPSIQTMELKLQSLKQAMKIKSENKEAELVDLTRKWKDAGREVAYEVWSIIKDKAREDDARYDLCALPNSREPLENSWGWGADEESPSDVDASGSYITGRTPGRFEGSLALYTIHGDEDNTILRNTMGIMLMQLGIAPKTLGWNEEECTFVDN